MQGAKEVQQTAQVFFPAHVASKRVYWHLALAALTPVALCKLLKAATEEQKPLVNCARMSMEASPLLRRTRARPHLATAWRCHVCHMLAKRPADILRHFKACHYQQNQHIWEPPLQVQRPASLLGQKPPCISAPEARACVGVRDKFGCLALRQAGAHAVVSLLDLTATCRCLHVFLQHVHFAPPGIDSPMGALSTADWASIFPVLVGVRLWRAFRNWRRPSPR